MYTDNIIRIHPEVKVPKPKKSKKSKKPKQDRIWPWILLGLFLGVWI